MIKKEWMRESIDRRQTNREIDRKTFFLLTIVIFVVVVCLFTLSSEAIEAFITHGKENKT
jgi:polyferredoxin